MRLKLVLAWMLSVGVVLPGTVWADEIDDLMAEVESEESIEIEEDFSGTSTEILPEIGEEDQLAVFVLDRGFYFTSDVGVLINFGGTQNNSNVQPFISTTVGYDINEYFSGQFYLSQGYVSQNPLSERDMPGGVMGNGTADYSLTNFGLEAVGALRPTARFAVEGSAGTGVTRLNPLITAEDGSSHLAWAPHVVAGVDFKYLTLLTDFSAGISINAYMVLNPQILSVSAAGVFRYTF